MLSLCITNYNRYDLLLESFSQVLGDPRISEIIISDDHSDQQIYRKLFEKFEGHRKVKVFRNAKNLGMSLNKRRAIELASNAWCILFDSDNVITPAYIDSLPEDFEEASFTIYCPSFAKPHFDYRELEGEVINILNVHKQIRKPSLGMLLNTCNYVVNRERYLATFRENKEMKGTDTKWFNYLHITSGGNFLVVPGMHYQHRVHKGSEFMKDADYNMRKDAELSKMFIKL